MIDLNSVKLYDDLKVLRLPSGYLTEDDKCGYDELLFAVRKEWLQNWYEEQCPEYTSDGISLDDWLKYNYEYEDAYEIYERAVDENEVIVTQKLWKANACYYEVWEESLSDGEHEMNTIIRTNSLESAKKAFRQAKADVMTDSILKANPENIQENFEDYESGEARLWYDGGSYSYGLYLTKREVELEDWNNA